MGFNIFYCHRLYYELVVWQQLMYSYMFRIPMLRRILINLMLSIHLMSGIRKNHFLLISFSPKGFNMYHQVRLVPCTNTVSTYTSKMKQMQEFRFYRSAQLSSTSNGGAQSAKIVNFCPPANQQQLIFSSAVGMDVMSTANPVGERGWSPHRQATVGSSGRGLAATTGRTHPLPGRRTVFYSTRRISLDRTVTDRQPLANLQVQEFGIRRIKGSIV